MRASQVDVPHLAFPMVLASDGKSFGVEEQDTSQEIVDCVEVILHTPQGRHPSLPDFGRPDLTFRQIGPDGLPLADVERMVETYEPRVDTLLTDAPDEFDQAVRNVAVEQGA